MQWGGTSEVERFIYVDESNTKGVAAFASHFRGKIQKPFGFSSNLGGQVMYILYISRPAVHC